MKQLQHRAWVVTAIVASFAAVAVQNACGQPVGGAVFLPNAPAATAVTPRLGAQLPLSRRFVNPHGGMAQLGSYFDGRRPVVVVPGYASCITLCGVVMQTILRTLSATGLPSSAYRVLSVSIDPDERADMVRARERGWQAQVAMLSPPPAMPEALIGEAASVAAVLSAMGIEVRRMPAFAHPAIAVIATPDGRVSGYVGALEHDAAALRQALVAASNGGLGSPIERFALRCAHLDGLSGRHTPVVLRGLQALGLALTAGLGCWLWRHRRALVAQRPAP